MSDDDSETTMTVVFEPRGSKSAVRTNAQDEQLSKARDKALFNRRTKTKAKLEARLAELRTALGGDLNNEQLERAVRHLIHIEEHHRSKLSAATEKFNEQIKKVNENLHVLAGKIEQVRPTRMKALSELSSVSESTRKG